nr:hypothetical protein [Morchella crassipes]
MTDNKYQPTATVVEYKEPIPTVEQLRNGAKLPSWYIQELKNPEANLKQDIMVCMGHPTKCKKTGCYMNAWQRTYCPIHRSEIASSSSPNYTSSSTSNSYSYTPNYSSSSYSSPSYYCQAGGCSSSVSSSGSYCSSHSNKCLNCDTRISSGNYYCYSHANQCTYCSTRIAREENYCSEHQDQVCLYCQDLIPSNPYRLFTPIYSISSSNQYCSPRCADMHRYSGYSIIRPRINQAPSQPTEPDRLNSLVKNRTSISGEIKEVVRFATNWNNNLATAINNGHWVFFLVYDQDSNSVKVFPTNATESKWGNSSRNRHNQLTNAQGEANWLREKLKQDSNPILVIHPSANEYVSFNYLVGSNCVPPARPPQRTTRVVCPSLSTYYLHSTVEREGGSESERGGVI